MGRKIISLCLVLLVFLAMPMTALAAEFDMDRLGSISVTLADPAEKTPIAGARLSLYRVATVELNGSGNPSYTFTETFAGCGVALDDPTLATVLDTFVRENAAPVDDQETDEQGTAKFGDLPLGLYFVKQSNAVPGYAPCTSFLVTVPNYGDEGYVYDVNASPKTDIARLTAISIRKVWNTDKSASATDSVTVELLRDGVVVATAVLNEQNQWQVVYADMPVSDAYSILEVNIPKGFVATYQQKGYEFTVTNTSTLIQTGQLVWPIPILALAGVFLIAVGAVTLRKTRGQNA